MVLKIEKWSAGVDQNPVQRNPSVLDDPSSLGVARVYAEALIGAAGGEASQVVQELNDFVSDVLNQPTQGQHPGLESLFLNRAIGRDEKIQIIGKVLTGRASQTLVNFLSVLADHERLELVRAVSYVANLELQKIQGRQHVVVTSAAPLTDEQQQAVRSRLNETLGLTPDLELNVDPNLVGGLVVRVGDTVYDGSLRTRLEQLRAQLRERCLNEIQRGRDRFCHSA